MNKDKLTKKLDYKKLFVRNTVQTKPKAVIIHEPQLVDSLGTSRRTSPSKGDNSSDITEQKLTLGYPELNSALEIAKKIDSIEAIKPRRLKSITELDKKSAVIISEKASKQLNFPYNQPIYKDLIPLCVKTHPPPQLPSVSKEFVIHKEKEPLLSDFFTPKTLSEYSFHVKPQPNNKTVIKQFDGLKLYRTMKNWN